MVRAGSSAKISVLALVLLITGAIDSIRNLPATALFGSSLIFFFIVSAIIFLIPVALISAELACLWADEEGGVYSWVRHALGSRSGFFTIWLQWINTIIWYPSILLFIAGVMAYLIDPALAQNKYYLVTTILTIFWFLTALGLKGLRASAFFASFCAITGLLLPIGFIIILALRWLLDGHPVAIDLDLKSLIPHWQEMQSWASLTAIMTSFLGMELAAVHVRNIQDPQRNFPKAMFFSVILILSTMIFGSLAIAFVVPQNEINLVAGVMQAFNRFLEAYQLKAFVPWMMLLILIGTVGSMINWIISPARGLLVAASHGFLPRWLYVLNRHGVASRILLLQAVLVTISCSCFLLFPSVNAIYWWFTDLSTELYMGMYCLLFIAAWRSKTKFADRPKAFVIPGGKVGYYGVCLLGLTGCILTFIVGFFPPEAHMNLGNVHYFRLVFVLGILLLLLPAFFLIWRNKRA